jgi:hypothetical protein
VSGVGLKKNKIFVSRVEIKEKLAKTLVNVCLAAEPTKKKRILQRAYSIGQPALKL